MEQSLPNSGKIIFLIGMPGVGKTTGGNKMAIRHGLSFVDLDTMIEQGEGKTIAELFEQDGESGFRKLERSYLEDIIKVTTTDTIIACGGGTPCFYDNMQVMKDAGTVIYLQADIPYLLNSLIETTAARPLLNNLDDLAAYLAHTLQQRKAIYEQAHHILRIEDISLATFDEIILSCINRH
jgi:shikimate kinase